MIGSERDVVSRLARTELRGKLSRRRLTRLVKAGESGVYQVRDNARGLSLSVLVGVSGTLNGSMDVLLRREDMPVGMCDLELCSSRLVAFSLRRVNLRNLRISVLGIGGSVGRLFPLSLRLARDNVLG